MDFAELTDFPELTKLMQRVQTLGKGMNSQKRIELTEKDQAPKKEVASLSANPLCRLITMPMVWNISIGQPGLAAWLCSLSAPAQLLIS